MADFETEFSPDFEDFDGEQKNRMRVTKVESDKLIAYLESPVSMGLWRAKFFWSEGVSQKLWAIIEKEIEGKEFLTLNGGKREKRLRLTPNWKKSAKKEIFQRISFIFTLFSALAKAEEAESALGANHELVQQILDFFDLTSITAEYAEAIKLFREEIWTSDFYPVTQLHNITRIKAGSLVFTAGPVNGDADVVAIAWDAEPLKALSKFFTAIGKADELVLMPIFSPEEELFSPYFDFLGLVKEVLIDQTHLLPPINKAINNFSEGNFTDCVSSLGLAAEDVLTQIFETLYREQLTKGLTLGQLVDEIHARANAKFKKKDEGPPDLSVLYGDIKDILDADEEANSGKLALELLRKMTAILIESQKHTLLRIDKVGKPEKKLSLFSDHISHAVTELIRYRNAASHKSRIPIGPMECRRAAYYFVALYTWWSKEKTAIDWSKSADEILKECISRNAKGH